MEFKYYVDRKHTCWERTYFVIDDFETKEEADLKAIELVEAHNEDENGDGDSELLDDTVEDMTVQENEGFAVTELYDDSTNVQIYNDSIKGTG